MKSTTPKGPQVVCCVCKQEVSKRQTLFIGSGRACRDHNETMAYVQELEAQESFRKSDDNLTVLMLVESARCLISVGYPVSVAVANIRQSLRKSNRSHLIDRVCNDIALKGALTSEEITAAVSLMPHVRSLMNK